MEDDRRSHDSCFYHKKNTLWLNRQAVQLAKVTVVVLTQTSPFSHFNGVNAVREGDCHLVFSILLLHFFALTIFITIVILYESALIFWKTHFEQLQ